MRRQLLGLGATVAGLVAVVVSHPGKAPGMKPAATSKAAGPPPQVSGPVAPSTGGASGSATGKAENYGYGTLDVSVSVSGGRIVDVSVPQLHTLESYSQSIAQQVIPMLRQEVLQAQSANIQGVSGATYTSEAYAYSLQAALTTLGFK
ncbi:MAG: FMN-binding protein [Actinomycetota bacterium]|nr:FMN-binding protein [Actinomycetota bacterium]